MTMWLAITLVGLGSYAFRIIPMLLGERMRVSPRAEETLRHGAVGAMTALLVLGVQRAVAETPGADTIAVAAALAVAGAVALVGRSMPWVVACGALSYGLTLGLVSLA